MSMRILHPATIEDLLAVADKAELIAGRIVLMSPTGYKPSRIAGRISRSLDDFASATGQGEAFTDNVGFAVSGLTSGRQSFSPDAAYHLGPFPADPMRFIEGGPTFAVEVRSEGEGRPRTESDRTAKRADYFEAGTLAVWDVDPVSETIHLYLPASATTPARTFLRADLAHAEPAVPGWTIGDVFR